MADKSSSEKPPPPSSSSSSSSTGCQECDQLRREFDKTPGGTPPRRKGLIVAAVAGGSALALSALCLPFVTPALRRVCLPYVPATEQQVRNVFRALEEARSSSGSDRGRRKLVDLGSGDGRIVLQAARLGFQAHGIELNLWLVLFSRARSLLGGLSDTATFSRQDLWKADLSRFDDVVIFGGEDMMEELEKKLDADLPSSSPSSDCRVVACRFPLPGRRPSLEVGSGIDTVWLYRPTGTGLPRPTKSEVPTI